MSMRFQNKGEKDLFEQFQTQDKEIKKKTKLLLPNIKKSLNLSYENAIFLAIGVLMACVICFTLGVENGKGRAVARTERPAPNHSLRSGTRQAVTIENLGVVQKIPAEIESAPKEAYVIQLAAFKKRDSAERGQAELKGRGYQAEIKQSGDYYQLYIGGFKSKKEAESLQGKLRDTYRDCYIKKY